MKANLPLPDDKKLTAVFRVEPGCLGPNGDDLVAGFCEFAEKSLRSFHFELVIWQVSPRADKAQPEMEYKVNNKSLTHVQADQYLGLFQENLDDFEAKMYDHIAELIDLYLQ